MQWIQIAGLGATLMVILAVRAQTQTLELAPAPAQSLAESSASATSAPAFPLPQPFRLVAKRRRLGFLESPRLFQAAQGLLVGTASFDYIQTALGIASRPVLHLTVVSPGLTRTVNFNFSARFAEGGWAKFVGPHNAVGVIALNAGADVLLALAARHLARRGPRWRLLATAVLVAQSLAHIHGGRSWIGLSGRIAAPYAQFNPVWQF